MSCSTGATSPSNDRSTFQQGGGGGQRRRGAALLSGTTALRSACLLGLTGVWREIVGVVDVAVVGPRGQQFGGEREVG